MRHQARQLCRGARLPEFTFGTASPAPQMPEDLTRQHRLPGACFSALGGPALGRAPGAQACRAVLGLGSCQGREDKHVAVGGPHRKRCQLPALSLLPVRALAPLPPGLLGGGCQGCRSSALELPSSC